MVVETEAEWDDEQRSQALGLRAYERGICACGFHSSLTNDKSNFYTFEVATCPVCAGADQFNRRQGAADEQASKALGDNPSPLRSEPADGRRTFIRQLSPTEVEQVKRGRAHRGDT